ncbi:MAG: tetratricopeptide repeat protein, partial [Gammaproteobacteria bacterium]
LDAGLREHQQGRSAAAASVYRSVLARAPAHVDALHLLGVALRDCGDYPEALQTLERVVRLAPTFAEAHGNLGMVLAEMGRPLDAAAAYRCALALKPALAEPWYNLGNLARERGDLSEAARCFEAALARRPTAEVWQKFADLSVRMQRLPEAAEAYRAARDLAPEDPEIWNRYGAVLQSLRRFEEAVVCHHRAIQLRPDFAEAHNNLGNALKDFRRPAEAVICYRRALDLDPKLVAAWNNLGNACLDLGAAADALAALRQALALAPEFADAHLNLGNVLKRLGHLEEATYCFNRALSLKPDFVQAHNNLGVVLTERGQHVDAIAHLERALTLDPEFAEAHNNLGNVYKNQARLAEALAAFQKALNLRPDYSGAHSNLLFTLNYVDGVTPREIFELSRDFNTRHAAHLAPESFTYQNNRLPERRLKIGYVSPDFRAHACAFFLEPLFRYHDRTAVEVHAYAEVAFPDAVTARLQGLVDCWHSTVGLHDERVADQIRADGIDIVIDLAGHTASGRLLALARKPAPIQVTYLGYPATTGLDVVDYRLTDRWTEPAGACEDYYTEALVRLPHSLWCYQPFADMPAVTELPALRRGHLTFGSFNNFAKVGPRVIALWARVLQAIPDSRLIAITVPAGSAQEKLKAAFADYGIAPSRIVLRDRLLRQRYLDLFNEVDVALDPFPCNGGTTTCDALWMGLPVVTLIGDTFLSRASYSLLQTTGFGRYAAENDAAYVAICLDAADDLPALAAVRNNMRERLAQSPLLDARSFARDVEHVYREMWRRWCAG